MQSSAIVAAETYPTEFYGHLGLGRVIGKRRQEGRAALAPKLRSAALDLRIGLAPDLQAQIDEGFGATSHGEDAFDAFVGMVGMINVISGRRRRASRAMTTASRPSRAGSWGKRRSRVRPPDAGVEHQNSVS